MCSKKLFVASLEAKDRNARGPGQGPRTQEQVFSKKRVFKIFFQAISKRGKQKRSLQLYREVSGVFLHNFKNEQISTIVGTRGGVENTRLEAKAKDTKKIRGQGQGQPYRGQTLSRPRTGMLEAKAKDQGHKRKCSPKKKMSSQKFFRRSPKKKKKGLHKNFQAISAKKRFPKNFSSASQNFNKSKNTSSRGQANFRGLEASRPRPRTSKCVLEAKDVLEDSTSGRNRCKCTSRYMGILRYKLSRRGFASVLC